MIPLLPQPLLKLVLSFAVSGYDTGLHPLGQSPHRCSGVASGALKELQTVCKAWLPPLRAVLGQYNHKILTLTLRTTSTEELRQIYHRVETAGAQVTELYVSIEPSYDFQAAVEAADVDWPAIFQKLPGLKFLDLTKINFKSRHLVAALDAVATHCLELEGLLLPYQAYGVEEAEIQFVISKLYAALKRWRGLGNCGGLRRLSVPTRMIKPSVQACREFFGNVAAHCPLVEYLDGYKASLSTDGHCGVRDSWLLTIEDWRQFNAVCTNLREFNWVIAPFGDPYFRVFGEYVKPQLKTLTFAVNMFWNWNWYLIDTSEAAGALPDVDWKEEYCERPGYGSLATDPGAALRGCPSLETLKVILYHPVDEDFLVDPYVHDISGFRDEEMLNQDAFGDNFCEMLATHCPFLTSLIIEEVAELYNAFEMKPISTFTDQGLMALTRLKYLQSVELRSINCTGKGLLNFLNGLSDDFVGNRTFEIYVGGSSSESEMTFYDVVKELLQELAQITDASCTRRKFALRIQNWSYNSNHEVERSWSETYLNELRQLMKQVEAAHPSLRQHVVTMDRSGNTFMRMAEFGIYSMHTDSEYYDWEDWEALHESSSTAKITFADRERMDNDNAGEFEEEYPMQMLAGDFYDDEGIDPDEDIDGDSGEM